MMTRIYLFLLLAAALALETAAVALPRVDRSSLSFDNIPPVPADLAEKLDAYTSARQAMPLGFSPKGQLLIATRFGDVEQLHVVEHAGGERRQLTFMREAVDRAAFSPDPGRSAYAFLKNAGGSDNAQLYYQRQGQPGPKMLTDGKSRNGALLWSNSGREVAFFSNARDGLSNDIDIVDPDGGGLPRVAVTGDASAWYPLDWSPDDRKLLVLKSVSKSEGYLYVVELSTGQKREVEPANARVAILGAKFSRDGQGVYLISDRESDVARVRYVNLFNAERSIVSAPTAWDIEELAISRDGHYLAYVSNEAGLSKLNVLDLRTHQDLTPPRLPAPGIISALSFDAEGKHLAFGYTAANQPEDAYVLDVAANRIEAWTFSEPGGADPAKFAIPHLAQFPTFDRPDGRPREIPVYAYDPAGPGPHPVLILLHDGPDSQFRPVFDPWIQYVVNELGFAVIAPNVRGSTGYGRNYAALDKGGLREDAVKDIGALLVWIGLQSGYDAKHMVVAGDGDGGYMALAALANFNDRLQGGVVVAGYADFVSFLTNTAASAQIAHRAEYGDERDPEVRAYLRRISPLTNADRISRPVLVVHGKNDARVPISEADLLVNRLRAKSSAVWYLTAADEGHGFRKQSNRDAYYRSFAQFLISLR